MRRRSMTLMIKRRKQEIGEPDEEEDDYKREWNDEEEVNDKEEDNYERE